MPGWSIFSQPARLTRKKQTVRIENKVFIANFYKLAFVGLMLGACDSINNPQNGKSVGGDCQAVLHQEHEEPYDKKIEDVFTGEFFSSDFWLY